MKIPVLQSLKSSLNLILGILILLFVVHSCKKEETIRPLKPLIAEYKTWFDTHIASRPDQPADHSLRHSAAKKPRWNKAYEKTISIGQAVIVPFEYSNQLAVLVGKNKDKALLKDISYLIMYKNKQGIFQAEVVTRIPDHHYWDEGRAAGKDFYGIVMVEDWWGKPIKTFKKDLNGKISYMSKATLQSGKMSSSNVMPGDRLAYVAPDDDCEVKVTTNDLGMYEVELICKPFGGGGDSGFGDGPNKMPHGDDWGEVEGHHNSGGSSEGSTPASSGSGYNNGSDLDPKDYDDAIHRDRRRCTNENHHHYWCNDDLPLPEKLVKEIKNNLQNPCLKSTLDNMINKDLNNKIGYILTEIFGQSKSLNLNFSETNNLPDSINGRYSHYTVSDNGKIDFFIELNGNTLPNAAIEFTSVTMIHEALHAYFREEGLEQIWDHEEIALGYRDALSAFLLQLYPNSLTSEVANALVWEGLQGTSIWTSFKNSNPNRANHIMEINSIFHDGLQGRKCIE